MLELGNGVWSGEGSFQSFEEHSRILCVVLFKRVLTSRWLKCEGVFEKKCVPKAKRLQNQPSQTKFNFPLSLTLHQTGGEIDLVSESSAPVVPEQDWRDFFLPAAEKVNTCNHNIYLAVTLVCNSTGGCTDQTHDFKPRGISAHFLSCFCARCLCICWGGGVVTVSPCVFRSVWYGFFFLACERKYTRRGGGGERRRGWKNEFADKYWYFSVPSKLLVILRVFLLVCFCPSLFLGGGRF